MSIVTDLGFKVGGKYKFTEWSDLCDSVEASHIERGDVSLQTVFTLVRDDEDSKPKFEAHRSNGHLLDFWFFNVNEVDLVEVNDFMGIPTIPMKLEVAPVQKTEVPYEIAVEDTETVIRVSRKLTKEEIIAILNIII